MNNGQLKELCLSLMKADKEEEVIKLLDDAGYWNSPSAWRDFGDNENNYSTIGNQQSRPDAALVEKLVNAADHRLLNECLIRGIDPEGSTAPQTIQQSVAQFFDEKANPSRVRAGLIKDWSNQKRTDVARGITLVATGAMPRDGNPCFTISDCGEGQVPNRMPDTLLSLNKSNKLRIPFVQGKFNMGGTGVLKFCGRHGLQLIVSRRNPALLDGDKQSSSDSQWSFTVVRREDPEGGRRSSVYTFLALLDGGVMRFSADSMPIFPDGREAYARESEWGTLIKLYEYACSGFSKSHILRKDGLMGRVELLLPDVALPIRAYECRPGYRGHEGSFETTITGLGVRLEDGRQENIEDEFPSSSSISVSGEQMTATIYAFKEGKADAYRKNEGIIFTINGQTHGSLSTNFFMRKNAGRLNYIAESIFIIVDCSNIAGRAREDLFMNSRDRLSGGPLRVELESELEDLLKNHQGLRALTERRRRAQIETKLDGDKPLVDILDALLKQSPTLQALFLPGQHISKPFKTMKAQTGEKAFEGKRYPTFFKFLGKPYGMELHRDCHINLRCRILFETDVINDYFSRDVEKGELTLSIVVENSKLAVDDYSMNLQNGIASLSVKLPANCREGDVLHFVVEVRDPTQIEPFVNSFVVDVKEATEVSNGIKRRRKLPARTGEGIDREVPAGISLPYIEEVYEVGWEKKTPPFNEYTALRIRIASTPGDNSENGNGQDVYDFFVNMDNIFLKSELKGSSQDPKATRARFKYGMVLLGLALLQREAQTVKAKSFDENAENDNGGEENNIQQRIEDFTRAVAPVLLPMIEYLGGDLNLEEVPDVDVSGEAT